MESRYYARCACKTKTVHLHYEIQGRKEVAKLTNNVMEDLAQTVMNQLQMNDGSSSHLLLATWEDRGMRDHILVLPITKNGTMSYNVQVARRGKFYGLVANHDFNKWHPDKLFNVATSAQAADCLMCNAKARHEARDGDYPYLMLTVGLFGTNLFNQTPMKFKSQEAVKELIDMLGSMRPTVEA